MATRSTAPAQPAGNAEDRHMLIRADWMTQSEVWRLALSVRQREGS